MSEEHLQKDKLERTLGLPTALAIGIGTMVGAGIFVFPGIAAGYAGPAAMLSFALGGIVALLVALPTAELATAMPESGGGYYFISRSFGPLIGMVVGIAQWFGLVFASAFYLVGFGQYTVELFSKLGVSLGSPVVLVALASALVLTLINLLGTERAGDLQNSVVMALTSILTVLLGYGLLNTAGLIGTSSWPAPFFSEGMWPVFTTTAVIFTSYLGFVQIATVAGEIKEPHKTLPRALAGSVIVVMTLYILTIFVSTSVLPNDRLAELGETAMVAVSETLVGKIGAYGILGAGLLATLSSANASILSSSRAVYALSKDDFLPSFISNISERFGTPYVALYIVGVPIAAITLFGRVELLAEVASLLHLVIYGFICLSLIKLRQSEPLWFAPTYQVPGGILIPLLGAIASFGLIAMMRPLSLLLGTGVIAGAIAWYYVYARNISLDIPTPGHVVPSLREPRILLPVELMDSGESLPYYLLRAFGRLKVFLLGYKIVPEQTAPEQSREEEGEEVSEELESISDELQRYGIDVESEINYTPDISKTLARYGKEEHCQALLLPGEIQSLKRLLVPLSSLDQINVRMATLLRDLAYSSRLPITILIVGTEQEDIDVEGIQLLSREQLEMAGLKSRQIRTKKVEIPNMVKVVTQVAGDEDLLVLVESMSQEKEAFIKSTTDKIKEAVTCPTLVVLSKEEEGGSDN
ncbi:Amino acid transporter [Fodinibius salinus]|uniref:Amino acid transporter n=1 Tax=Fodinibius salinus TaxID=860790 RepID=A0A5D3YKD7_9BACT|nr:APC family permease [Fodinibius salinus]TYP92192.1 Amino acid transporter [Fodinibius salinus]